MPWKIPNPGEEALQNAPRSAQKLGGLGAVFEVSFSAQRCRRCAWFPVVSLADTLGGEALVADGGDGVHCSVSVWPPVSGAEQVCVRCIGMYWWSSATLQTLMPAMFSFNLHQRNAN